MVRLGKLYDKYMDAALNGVLSNLNQVKHVLNDKTLNGFIDNIAVEFVQQLTDVVTESRSRLYIPNLQNNEIRLHLFRIRNDLNPIQIDKIKNLWNLIDHQIKLAMRGAVNRIISTSERNDPNKEMAKKLGMKIEAFSNIMQDYIFEPILQKEEEIRELAKKYQLSTQPKTTPEPESQEVDTKTALSLKEDEIRFTIEDLVQG